MNIKVRAGKAVLTLSKPERQLLAGAAGLVNGIATHGGGDLADKAKAARDGLQALLDAVCAEPNGTAG